MPGKVNPVIAESVLMVCAQVIGYDAAITWCCAAGNFELNVMMPVMAYDLLEPWSCWRRDAELSVEAWWTGSKRTVSARGAFVEQSLAMATSLAPEIGYDKAAALAKEAYASGTHHSGRRSGEERHSGRAAE